MDRRLSLYKKGYSDSEIAKEERIDRMRIYRWRKKNSLPPNYSKAKLKEAEQKKILSILGRKTRGKAIGISTRKITQLVDFPIKVDRLALFLKYHPKIENTNKGTCKAKWRYKSDTNRRKKEVIRWE